MVWLWYVFRVGFPTLVFMFDWRKCVHISKSLVKPRSDFEQRLIHDTSALGFRLFNKMFFKCIFLVLGLFSDMEELSQLSLLTLLAVCSNCLTFVTVFPALNILQQNMQTGTCLAISFVFVSRITGHLLFFSMNFYFQTRIDWGDCLKNTILVGRLLRMLPNFLGIFTADQSLIACIIRSLLLI